MKTALTVPLFCHRFQVERRRVLLFLCPVHTQPFSGAVEVSGAHQLTSTAVERQTREFRASFREQLIYKSIAPEKCFDK